MAKPNKAQIKYKTENGAESVETTLRFHSIESEGHEASSTITKYPAQTGKVVSNNAIKENRKVSIVGYITNHLIVGAEEFHEYGSNNVRIVFSTLNALVDLSIPCEVQTNYGDYSPVIFNRMRTKMVAGTTDTMKFTLSGEETQLGLVDNKTAPTLLSFTPLTEDERATRVAELAGVGIDVPADAVVSQAPVDFNASFKVAGRNLAGKSTTTTYERKTYDPTTKTYTHEVHTSDTEVAGAVASTELNWFQMMQEESGVNLHAGALTSGACLVDEITGLANDTADGFIQTGLGELKSTIYGAAYGLLGVNGDRGLGQVIMSLGLDCLIAGAIGSVDETLNPDDFQDNDLPTVDEVVKGATSTGDSVATKILGVAAPTTLTKISPPNTDITFFGDLF